MIATRHSAASAAVRSASADDAPYDGDVTQPTVTCEARISLIAHGDPGEA